MFEEVLVPLVLASMLGEIRGRTRFQKLMFFIQKKAKSEGMANVSFDFKLYLYGPFSVSLNHTIDDLVAHQYLTETLEETPNGYVMHVYAMTKKGKSLLNMAKNKGLITLQLSQIIEEIAEKYGELPLPLLVEEAYAQC